MQRGGKMGASGGSLVEARWKLVVVARGAGTETCGSNRRQQEARHTQSQTHATGQYDNTMTTVCADANVARPSAAPNMQQQWEEGESRGVAVW